MIKVTGLKKHFGDLEVLKGIDQHINHDDEDGDVQRQHHVVLDLPRVVCGHGRGAEVVGRDAPGGRYFESL